MKKVALFLCLLAVLAACSPQEPSAEKNGQTESSEQPAPDPSLATAQAHAGTWSGTWKNLEFLTEGTAQATVEVDEIERTVTITVLEGHGAIGTNNAPPITFTGQLDGRTEYEGTVEIFGMILVKMDWDALSFSFEAPNVPDPGVRTVVANGKIVDGKFTVEATITFEEGTTAKSTAEMTKN